MSFKTKSGILSIFLFVPLKKCPTFWICLTVYSCCHLPCSYICCRFYKLLVQPKALMGFQLEAFSERIPPTASHFISGPLWNRRQGRIRSTKDLFGERTVKDREGGSKRKWREVQTPGHNWLFWKEKREKENWVGRPSDCSTTLNVSWPDQGNGTTGQRLPLTEISWCAEMTWVYYSCCGHPGSSPGWACGLLTNRTLCWILRVWRPESISPLQSLQQVLSRAAHASASHIACQKACTIWFSHC